MSNSSDFQCFARVPLVLASQSPTSFSKFGRVRPRYRAVVEGRCTLFLSPAQWLHVRCLAFRCKGRSFALQVLFKDRDGCFPESANLGWRRSRNKLQWLVASFAGSCDKGTTKGARTNECGVCEEGRTGREEERKGKEKWRGGLLDLGLLRRNVKRPRVGQSRGPLFWLQALFLLYLIPAIDNLLIAFSICLPVSIYMYVCLFISR
ncbi:hypothetical protein BGZ57DRAFT_442403 [Hyaloscypha finlandica]|nr:hypothetical protein BGZ57DRAFT_442403 [Hyaloscypha finlandica]